MTKKWMVLLAITAVVAAVVYFIFMLRPVEQPEAVKQAKELVKSIQVKADSINGEYYREIEKLKRENDSLYYQLRVSKANLMKAKQAALATNSKASKLSEKVKAEKDTVQKLNYCDSLQQEVDSLIIQSEVRDSLCDETIEDLGAIIENQDSIIVAGERQAEELKQLLNTSLDQQSALTQNLESLNKKLERKKRGQRWMAASLTFISGIASAIFISHRSQ